MYPCQIGPCNPGAGHPTGGDGARQGQGAGGPLPRPIRPATHYQGIQLSIMECLLFT